MSRQLHSRLPALRCHLDLLANLSGKAHNIVSCRPTNQLIFQYIKLWLTYVFFFFSGKQIKSVGTHVSKNYNLDSVLKNPPKPADVTLEMLLTAQSHLGHTTSRWNPHNSRYIFGVREGIHIISLDVTAAYLRRAAKVVEEVARCGGLILFVGTRPGQKKAVVRAAELAKGYHVFERWIPGSLTNSQQILGNCAVKVVNALDDELPDFTNRIDLEVAIKPDLVVCFNPIENEVLLHECGLNNIPTIGVIDTDSDPTRVTYPIPANDDSVSCLEIISGVLGRAGEEGQRRRLEEASRGVLTYTPVSLNKFKKEDPFGNTDTEVESAASETEAANETKATGKTDTISKADTASESKAASKAESAGEAKPVSESKDT